MNSKWEDEPTIPKLTVEYREAIDIFPALHKYKTEHNITNLQKLCVEIADFCRAVYSSTTSPQERQIFFDMLDKLQKK